MKRSAKNGCETVAIPSVFTGIFGYPLDAAIEIAVREVKAFVVRQLCSDKEFSVLGKSWIGVMLVDYDGVGCTFRSEYHNEIKMLDPLMGDLFVERETAAPRCLSLGERVEQ